jgi:hypothetical protein
MTCSCLPVLEARTWWIHVPRERARGRLGATRTRHGGVDAVVALTEKSLFQTLNSLRKSETNPKLLFPENRTLNSLIPANPG